MTRAAKLPEITQPRFTKDQNNLSQSLHSIIETLQIREGKKGNLLDKNVTLRELIGSGIVKIKPGGGYSFGGGINVDLIQPGTPIVLSKPPKPTGVTVSPGFDSVRINWNAEAIDYGAHAYAEIFRNETDNVASATLVGRSEFFGFSDNVNANTLYYYWVRFVSVHGVKGEFQSLAGLPAQTFVDPDKVLDNLADKIQTTHLAEALRTPLTDTLDLWTAQVSVGDITAGIGLWIDPETTKSWFMARADQFAFINPAGNGSVVPFYIESNTVYMDTALIKTAAITNAHIQTLDVTKVTGDKAAFIHANIDYVQVGDGVFSGGLSSVNYSAGSGFFNEGGAGWRIVKDDGSGGSKIEIHSGVFGGELKASNFYGGKIYGSLLISSQAALAESDFGDGYYGRISQDYFEFSDLPNTPWETLKGSGSVHVHYRGEVDALSHANTDHQATTPFIALKAYNYADQNEYNRYLKAAINPAAEFEFDTWGGSFPLNGIIQVTLWARVEATGQIKCIDEAQYSNALQEFSSPFRSANTIKVKGFTLTRNSDWTLWTVAIDETLIASYDFNDCDAVCIGFMMRNGEYSGSLIGVTSANLIRTKIFDTLEWTPWTPPA